jgi:hypothetical protein
MRLSESTRATWLVQGRIELLGCMSKRAWRVRFGVYSWHCGRKQELDSDHARLDADMQRRWTSAGRVVDE